MVATALAVMFALVLSLNSAEAASAIYQWTDDEGVIHFTDRQDRVPASARRSPSFAVREIDETQTAVPLNPAPDTTQLPESARSPEPWAEPVDRAPVIYAPQEVTIVVLNTLRPRPHRPPCKGSACMPVFRPDFGNRRFIHPSVFDGGSRQHVQPR